MDTPITSSMHADLSAQQRREVEGRASELRSAEPGFARWAAGYGVIRHDPLTQVRVHAMVGALAASGALPDPGTGYRRLLAADRIASAGMWLVVHMTYARRVRTDGTPLAAADFKPRPDGHTGGSLNMVPAYTAYLVLNALDGNTRSWMMGQGHCVAAVDALNVVVGNMTEAHAARYGRDEAGLSRLVTDFYSFAIGPDGRPDSPLGSHVNAHTAGGMLEGGYLGFAELKYVHSPLPHERLVAFLSDGAFEEQRGSDWASRWWRPQDCGLVAPILILNGRRIEQRSEIAQQGGERWLHQYLQLNGFEPIAVDGRDPASIAWAIHTIEANLLETIGGSGSDDRRRYKSLYYGIADTIKGFGFPGAGTNRAHNLPLPGNPRADEASRKLFNDATSTLFVPSEELDQAVAALATHVAQGRPLERDHPLATRDVALPLIPAEPWDDPEPPSSPMAALDRHFSAIVQANPQLRPRVGNPDELRSNRLDLTLDLLKHRVDVPEPGVAESRTGNVITVLNEEAVVCAALANKGGLNLVVTYEAFAPKMLGALRQEITFSRQLALAGRPPRWLSVPVVLTSHTWENSKNEISHQDPTLAEALIGEMADTAGVVFPPDANAAIAAMSRVYRSHGRIVTLIVPKRPVANMLTPVQGRQLADDGALVVSGDPHSAQLLLVPVGAYQLDAAMRAATRLAERDIAAAVIYVGEPARFRQPRDEHEAQYVHDDAFVGALFPPATARVVIGHTRPEPLLGALRRVDTGPATTTALGFINRGGTLDVDGLLFANRSTWAHVLEAVAKVLSMRLEDLLDEPELAAVQGRGDPTWLWRGEHH